MADVRQLKEEADSKEDELMVQHQKYSRQDSASRKELAQMEQTIKSLSK